MNVHTRALHKARDPRGRRTLLTIARARVCTCRLQVPDGHIWIEGDNPQNSLDSRTYGPIPAAAVTGRVVATVWPPWRARRLRAGEPRPASNTMLESAMLADPDVVSHAHHLAKRAAAGHRRHQENMKALADVLAALEKAKEEEKAREGAAAANTTTPDEVARDVTVEASSDSVNAPVPRTD
ncbi:hypothetical protein EON66_10730 [archaeon]|nr:MAG: hypothetical protein EON66_10730 [archaeon]